MANDPKDVRCFQLTIELSTDNDPSAGRIVYAAAGNNHGEMVSQPPRFSTDQAMGGTTVCIQLLKKLAKAVEDGSETIKIRVGDGGLILPDPVPGRTAGLAATIPTAEPIVVTRGLAMANARKASPKMAKSAAKASPKTSKSASDVPSKNAMPKAKKATTASKRKKS